MDTKHLRNLLKDKANVLMDNPSHLELNLRDIAKLINQIDKLELQMSEVYKFLNSDRFGLDIIPTIKID